MTNSEQTAQRDILEPFESYARAAGAQVSIVTTEAGAAAVIASGAEGRIIYTAAVRERFPELCQAVEAAGSETAIAEGIAETASDPSTLAAKLSGGVGIVLAQAGVAETGSVVLADDALAPRLLSMLADVCVALLPSSAIVSSLDEAGALLAELDKRGHRYVSLVTGPSRTADIERVLTIGVQGPKALHIVVLVEEGA
ncbi:MAG TPA: LUD domain-containing protein [Chloroflexia bacterium]|nr:LUD domain-containing protein [Chloroflexia bacterium]